MSESMVERAAEAAYEYTRVNWWTDYAKPWVELSDSERVHWLGAQRAAITAMREPTEAMLNAANADPVTHVVNSLIAIAGVHGATLAREYRDDNTPIRRWWRAMIDRALIGP
jgi:hypothetical protein